jgi:hypothetical protein
MFLLRYAFGDSRKKFERALVVLSLRANPADNSFDMNTPKHLIAMFISLFIELILCTREFIWLPKILRQYFIYYLPFKRYHTHKN